METNHSNAKVIILDGESLYEKGFYISSEDNIDSATASHISFSKPLQHEEKTMIITNMRDSSFLVINKEDRFRLAMWLLDIDNPELVCICDHCRMPPAACRHRNTGPSRGAP